MSDERRLSDDELAYHRTVLDAVRRAEAARDLWTAHLAARYGLVAGDQIDADGAIRRPTTLGSKGG